MRKVKIIEPQKEEVREVTGSEAEELLRKYGYGQEDKHISTRLPDKKDTSKLTFEELIKLHEEEQSALKAKKEDKTKDEQSKKLFLTFLFTRSQACSFNPCNNR